jgi:voltage-gated sodium channel
MFFNRMNFAMSGASRQDRHVKTDAELLAEVKGVQNHQMTDIGEEFGDMPEFGKVVDFCRQLSHDGGKYETYFTGFIVLTIMLAGVLVGLDTYDSLSDLPELVALDTFIVVIFASEVVIKVLSYGKRPILYFTGDEGVWNTFDFIVVVFSMPFFAELTGNKSPAIRIVSRVFRLFRVAKILHQVPALQVIVQGLVGGFKSIFYVVTLLLLIFYLYAVFGVFMFRRNDPFHFSSVPVALMTLFRVCTLENWGENMYINMFGCKQFDANIYLVQEDVEAAEWEALEPMYKCRHPHAQLTLSIIYFITFVVVSSFVMLSLFIGVITMSMQASLNDMREEVEETNRKKKLLKAEEEMEKLAVRNTAMLITQRMAQGFGGSRQKYDANNLSKEDYETSSSSSSDSEDEKSYMQHLSKKVTKSFKKVKNMIPGLSSKTIPGSQKKKKLTAKEKKQMRDMVEMKSLLMQAWSGTKISSDYHHDLDLQQEGTVDKYIRHAGIFCRNLSENAYFNNSITGVIVLTAILVGIETDYRDDNNGGVFDVLEDVVFSIFAFEVIIRFVAEDCHVKEYFRSGWNTFDFLVVALSKIPGGGLVVVLLRLVRLLRVLKLVKSLPQLAVIVNALLMGISSIGYISVIMFLTFYLFGILGVLLFGENDLFNFGQLHLALIALFKIATLDNWGDPLYINFYGCDIYPPYFIQQDKIFKCSKSIAQPGLTIAFFTCFILIGALVMITLFVGVVTTSMERAHQEQMMQLEIETRIMDLCHERSVTPTQLDIYRRVFSMLDLDGGGTIEGEELRSGLQAVNIECTDEQLEVWVKEVDVNSDGVIDLIEFVIFMTNMKKKATEEHDKKMMRKGADAFLRLRKKAQARKEADGSGNGKVAVSESAPTVVDTKVEQIRASRGSVIQKRARRRSSINILTGGLLGGLLGSSNADDEDEDDDDDDDDESVQSNASSTISSTKASSPKASKPSFLSRMGSSLGFLPRVESSDDEDNVQDASTFGTPGKEDAKSQAHDATGKKYETVDTTGQKSPSTGSDNADITEKTAELSSSTLDKNNSTTPPDDNNLEVEDQEHLDFLDDLDTLSNSKDFDKTV